ncbi:MAG: hypothetical protein KJ606_05275 [Chloroflexi bacterium]|nr:hypothetical protein [Chloroflexota bacterium]
MKHNRFPPGWDEMRVKQVLAHYESQSEDNAAAEDEKAFKGKARTVIEVPIELMPVIREIIAQYEAVGHA